MSEDDPFLWLEEIEGEAALGWVARQNARTSAALDGDPRFDALYRAALEVLTAADRIPYPAFVGDRLTNFWQDETHIRGLWRETSLASFVTAEPAWRTLLDIDALSAAEERNWVFQGAASVPPDYRRALVSLSDGGKDAAEKREFDIAGGEFVDGGFFLPEGKQSAVWLDRDTLLVARDWGPGTMTRSGYPFVLKRVGRSMPLAGAVEIFRGGPDDVSVAASVLREPDGTARGILINRRVGFFDSEWHLLDGAGPIRLAMPARSSFRGFVAGQMIFSLEQAWDGRQIPAGALVSLDLAACLAEPRNAAPDVIVAPGPREAIEDVATTRSRLLVTLYRNVRGGAVAYRFENGGWIGGKLPLPEHAAVQLVTPSKRDEQVFLDIAGYLAPNTLYLADLAAATAEPVKSLPPRFGAANLAVEQFEAASADGTAVPYSVVRPKAMPLDGTAPTLLYGYGGFQVSLTPSYSGVLGKLWLERGGVYAVANIRGGGEFGPGWHRAALKRERIRAFEDFIAVAEDLIRRKITNPRRLGAMGGSNGGLLIGAMLTRRPELFHAVVIQVPLLDMLRYHRLLAGASWMAEYGNPDEAGEAEFLRRISPYHNLRPGLPYPEPLFVTSTKDDRVHPGHARKMAAKMAAMDLPFLYYENTEGGHAAAATLRERARRHALEFTYLTRKLMD
ncbi:MAG: prolyl oligopeptidase family protein [Alphaproteobacteria bacterium]